MSFFKKPSDFKKDQGLKYLLHNNLVRMDEPRSLDTLHASDLTKEDVEFCPRERSLLIRDGDARKGQFIGTSLNVTFQVGRWYEHKIRNEWLRNHVLGDWSCSSCGGLMRYQTAPGKCSECGELDANKITYIEPRAYSPKYQTSCGLDFLLWKDDMLTVTEVKTIAADQFKTLKAPLSEHRRRTQFYLDLLSHSTWMDFDVNINLDWAYVLYVSKGFGIHDQFEGREGLGDARFSPFKEFKVKRLPEGHESLQPIYEKALAVKKYKNKDKLPKRICTSITCKRAEQCPVKKTCFSESN